MPGSSPPENKRSTGPLVPSPWRCEPWATKEVLRHQRASSESACQIIEQHRKTSPTRTFTALECHLLCVKNECKRCSFDGGLSESVRHYPHLNNNHVYSRILILPLWRLETTVNTCLQTREDDTLCKLIHFELTHLCWRSQSNFLQLAIPKTMLTV